jgi:biopolymer transport protein ExbD
MKCLLSVCLAILAAVAIFVVHGSGQTPTLQKGISVQMAASSHASPMPDADNLDAWVITVTTDGRIYLGTDPLTTDALTEQMKAHPRNRTAKLYVKGDAGAPFSGVQQVLRAANTDRFDDVVLLTAEIAQPGAIVSPKGLDVSIGPEAGSSKYIDIQVTSVGHSPALTVNRKAVSPDSLQKTLAGLIGDRTDIPVILESPGQASFGDVVHIIDECRAAGASRVSVSTWSRW